MESLGWRDEPDAFCRLSNRAQKLVRELVWQLSRHSAGVLVRFVADATQISARWTLHNEALGMDHMAATGVMRLTIQALS